MQVLSFNKPITALRGFLPPAELALNTVVQLGSFFLFSPSYKPGFSLPKKNGNCEKSPGFFWLQFPNSGLHVEGNKWHIFLLVFLDFKTYSFMKNKWEMALLSIFENGEITEEKKMSSLRRSFSAICCPLIVCKHYRIWIFLDKLVEDLLKLHARCMLLLRPKNSQLSNSWKTGWI